MAERLTIERSNQIRAMEPADSTPEQVGKAIADLWWEIERQRSAVDDALVRSTIVGDILEKRLDGVPGIDPQYLADEITAALYRKIKGLDR